VAELNGCGHLGTCKTFEPTLCGRRPKAGTEGNHITCRLCWLAVIGAAKALRSVAAVRPRGLAVILLVIYTTPYSVRYSAVCSSAPKYPTGVCGG
jgi:hypothetical protein